MDKVSYWLNIADDDVSVARLLLKGKKYLHLGFFCHLITEKALKAVVESVTQETPPKIHDLKKLAKYGKIFDDLSQEQHDLLMDLTPFQMDARYPEYKTSIAQTLNAGKCKQMLKETEEFLCWVKKKLGK